MAVQYGLLHASRVTVGTPPMTYQHDRLCRYCGKLLTVYNPGPICFACEDRFGPFDEATTRLPLHEAAAMALTLLSAVPGEWVPAEVFREKLGSGSRKWVYTVIRVLRREGHTIVGRGLPDGGYRLTGTTAIGE